MVKPHNRTIGVIAILLILGTSSLSVAYSFADIEEDQEDKKGQNNPKSEKNTRKERLGAILTEKVVNGKLEVQHYTSPDDTTKEDMQRMVSFEGKASKVGENLWEITTNGMLTLEERQFDLELSGKSNGSHVVMHGTALDEDLSYKIIFSGKITETDEENVFAISFMNSGLKNPEIGQNIKFLQIGELAIDSGKSIVSNQEFRNSI